MVNNSPFNTLDVKNKTIRMLLIILGLMVTLLMHAYVLVVKAPQEMTVYYPPDLSVGGVARLGEAPKIMAYDFSFTMFSAINTWAEDGSKEQPKKHGQYKNYFGNEYLKVLEKNAKNNFQANKGRTRVVEFLENKYRVKRLRGNTFNVELVVRVVDKIRGHTLKDDNVTLFFKVVPSNVSRDINPWQLKIDGEYKPSVKVSNK